MATQQVIVPDIGDYHDVAVIDVLVKVGDAVAVDQAPAAQPTTGMITITAAPLDTVLWLVDGYWSLIMTSAGVRKTIPRGSLRHVDQNIETAYNHFYSLSMQHEIAGVKEKINAVEDVVSRGGLAEGCCHGSLLPEQA